MTHKLYHDLARYWPLVSPPQDYATEAAWLLEVIESAHGPSATVLELGAGGGHTLCHLVEAGCACTAVDLSEPMLAACRRLNPTVTTICADMRHLRLDQRFHAVLIHDAIDYMLEPADAKQAIATAAAHLLPGGVAIIAPTYFAETFEDGQWADDRGKSEREDGGEGVDENKPAAGVVRYVSRVTRLGKASYELRMTLVIVEDGHMRVEEDQHVCGLFTAQQWQDWIESAGLQHCADATFDSNGEPYHALVARLP